MSLNIHFLLILMFIAFTSQQPTFFKSTFKGLGGLTINRASLPAEDIRAVYYHEQTVAIVDVSRNNDLHNCNLIEVYEPFEAIEILKNLSVSTPPQMVQFHEMTKLMRQCEMLDKLQSDNTANSNTDMFQKNNRLTINPLTLLSGIIPGTKWCGTGDIAENYHDLGHDIDIDRCCRSHDLCPVKIRAQQTRYNLTNNSLYTKSHCACDEAFYNCLKSLQNPTGNIIALVYFNIVKVPCIEDVPKKHHSSMGFQRKFIPAKTYA